MARVSPPASRSGDIANSEKSEIAEEESIIWSLPRDIMVYPRYIIYIYIRKIFLSNGQENFSKPKSNLGRRYN